MKFHNTKNPGSANQGDVGIKQRLKFKSLAACSSVCSAGDIQAANPYKKTYDSSCAGQENSAAEPPLKPRSGINNIPVMIPAPAFTILILGLYLKNDKEK